MMDLFPRTAWTDPFQHVRHLQDDMERMLRTWTGAGTGEREYPPLNLWANETGVIVTAELPGVDPDALSITVHKNTLTLAGERKECRPDGEAAELRRELPAGRFSRTIALPFLVDGERVEAKAQAGLLVIHLPRPEADRPKRVRIATA